MTIEEAIEKEKSIAKSDHELANSYHTDFNVYMRQGGACRERAEYHEQVAEWLEELQRLKEQELCVDCISRHAVLETIDNRIEQIKRDANEINKSYSHLSFAEGIHDGYCRLKCDLRILSSVKPQEPYDFIALCEEESEETKWIPCSERSPKEEKKTYWICTNDGYQCECRWTNVNPFWTDLTTNWHWHIADVPQYSKVVAWMPLPEPYKVESEET